MAGTLGPIELPAIQGWDPRTGGSITRRFKGDQTLVAALALTHKAAGARIELTPPEEGGYSELRATYGASDTQPPGEPLADVWTLLGNDLEKDLWGHHKITAEFEKAVSDERGTVAAKCASIKAAIDAYVKGETTIEDSHGTLVPLTDEYILNGLVAYLGPGMDVTVWQHFLEAMLQGATTFISSQWVLRHSLVVANNTTIRPVIANVDCVYTTSSLVAAESIPLTIKFDLPAGTWLKKAPSVEQESADKWRITQEWWHDKKWNSWIYPDAT